MNGTQVFFLAEAEKTFTKLNLIAINYKLKKKKNMIGQ